MAETAERFEVGDKAKHTGKWKHLSLTVTRVSKNHRDVICTDGAIVLWTKAQYLRKA